MTAIERQELTEQENSKLNATIKSMRDMLDNKDKFLQVRGIHSSLLPPLSSFSLSSLSLSPFSALSLLLHSHTHAHIQSTKMVLKLLESRLNAVEKKGGSNAQSAEELAIIKEQVKSLKDLDSHPDLKRFAMENLELKGKRATMREMEESDNERQGREVRDERDEWKKECVV